MRVISGKARGHKLLAPTGLDVRPTLDRVKESVFSSIMPYLSDAVVLDLFSGSGGLGIEALSRGAARCDFVDKANQSMTATRKNLEATKLDSYAKTHLVDWKVFLKGTHEKYTLVFLDPPYYKGIKNEAMALLPSVMEDAGVVVLETEYSPLDFAGFSMIRQAKYGRVFVTLYKKMPAL